MSFRAAPIKCETCGKTVYAMEAMKADGKTFHKACMKCAECNCVLKLGNYAAVAGKYYCKPHFKQLFKLKGNYSSGFGEEGAAASHSFSVPTGRADFNRAPSRSPATPARAPAGHSPSASPSASPAPSHTPAASPAPSPAPSTSHGVSSAKPAPEPSSEPAPPTLASPTPTPLREHHRAPAPSPLGSSGGGASPAPAPLPRGLGASGPSAFDAEKKKLEAEKKAFEDEKRRFEEEKRKKDAELKAAVAAAEKDLSAAVREKDAAESKEKEPTPAAAVTLSATEQHICEAFGALVRDPAKKELALKKAGLK